MLLLASNMHLSSELMELFFHNRIFQKNVVIIAKIFHSKAFSVSLTNALLR